jgi:hypothetical protein
MDASDFWLDREARFRRLQPKPPQPGEVAQDSHNGLYAVWYAEPLYANGDQWSLGGGEHGVKEFFTSEAESAALALGHPKGPSSLSFWLDLLKCHSPFYRSFGETGGDLYRICDASAEYCHKLSSDAVALALARESVGAQTGPSVVCREGVLGQPQPAVVANGDTATESTTWARKRGRPQKISDELKTKAQARKHSGGTNREAAAILYETKRPTPQQVKNVSSILREYGKKESRQLDSSIKASPKTP